MAIDLKKLGYEPCDVPLIEHEIKSLADLPEEEKEKLRQAQQELQKRLYSNSTKCLHDKCTLCGGTGRKADGTPCPHMISCPCPRCSPKTL